ncbi:unnamed protein product, partial [Tilletia laevis]
MAAPRRVLPTAFLARLPFATASASTSTAAAPPPRPKRSRLPSSPTSTSTSDLLPTLLVGPPDPISNLRPIRYVSPLDRRVLPSSGAQQEGAISHPYSLSEFSTGHQHQHQQSQTTGTRAHRGAELEIEPSPYFQSLQSRLESASLAHRLRSSRAHTFDQRFWSDNNHRFARDLAASSTPHSPSPSETGENNAEFYTAWLSANADRHRAYNRVLVRRTFRDLAPEARWRVLVGW